MSRNALGRGLSALIREPECTGLGYSAFASTGRNNGTSRFERFRQSRPSRRRRNSGIRSFNAPRRKLYPY